MQLSSRLLSLPLAKYSRAADVSRDEQQFTWSHVQHDLAMVIDSFSDTHGDGNSSQVLRVLHGAQVLEAIPIQEMIAKSEDVIRTMLQLKVQVKNEQLPISALTRRPLFAVRYNLPSDKVRRLQLKFFSGDDFDRCYNHLRNLGLRMTTSAERPSTAANASTSAASTDSKGLSFPTARLAEINNRPSTALAFQSTSVNRTVPKVSSPLARHSITLGSHDQEPVHDVNRGTDALSRPKSAQRTHLLSPYSSLNPLEPPEYFPRPLSVSSSSSVDRPSTGASKEREHLLSRSTLEEQSSFPTVPPSSTMLSTQRHSSEALLPPRRELPFTRATPPKSAGSDGARPTSRATSASSPMGPPPLPAASQRRTSFGQSFGKEADGPGSPQALLRERSMENVENSTPTGAGFGSNQSSIGSCNHQPLPQPTFISETGNQMSARPKSNSGHPNSGYFDPRPLPQPTFMEHNERTGRTNSSPASYDVSAFSTQQAPSPLRSLSSAAQNALPPSSSVPTPPPEGYVASYQDRIIKEIYEDAHVNTNNNLASYASKSEDERRAILNDFMMQHLNDENFITLAEDVSTCWLRIGLGQE